MPTAGKFGGIDDDFVDDPDGVLKKKEQSRYKSKASEETKIDGLEQFAQYADLFRDLTLRTWVDTEMDVINIIITYDSKHCIAIVNEKDEYFEV